MADTDCVALSNQDILALWEAGEPRHDVDRALLIAAAAYPGIDWSALTHLPVGRRDSLIIRLRERMLGDVIPVTVQCPACQERLEFDTSASELLSCCPAEDAGTMVELELGEYRARARPLDSADLTTLRDGLSRADARAHLIGRAVEGAWHEGAPVAAAALPEAMIAALAAKLVEVDPVADLSFGLSCPACSHGWSASFDITNYFWRELSAMARTMLEDVHLLATAYGWREDDVLAMSAARRAFYLSRINP
jgi:hypothetical protein